MGKFLIVNADDFGLSAGVNRGIIEAHREGVVTSTTLLVNTPGFFNASALAGENPELAVGLHLNLTYGKPLLPPAVIPSLVDGRGNFTGEYLHVMEKGQVEDIRKEMAAQVERFMETGLPLSHLDTHHHLHQKEQILAVVAEICKRLGVPLRCLDEEAFKRIGLKPTARFIKFFGNKDPLGDLITIIERLDEGVTEIPCHPGYVDEELRALSPLTLIRENELKAIVDPRLHQVIEAQKISLTNYLNIGGGYYGGV